MSKTATMVLALAVGLALGIPLGGRLIPSFEEPAEAQSRATFAAVPNAIGAQDVSGPYEVVADWPKDLSTLPGHEKWTYGGARGIFAESPNRVYLLGGGELPKTARPQTRLFPEIGPNVQFPLAGLPWRNANTATPPGRRRLGSGPREGHGAVERRVAAVSRARRRFSLGALHRRRRRAGQDHRGVDAVGQDVQAPARRLHQPVRRTEARVGRRRPHARDLQVHERRQAAGPDDRHAERAGRRWHAFQSADVHGVAARRELLRFRRLQRHARREVRRARASSCWISACEASQERKHDRAT